MDNIKGDIKLVDFLDITRWKEILDRFSEVIGVNIHTVDLDGKPVTQPSKSVRFCWDLMTKSPRGILRCENCVSTLIGNLKKQNNNNLGCVCHAGLHNFAIPLRIGKNLAVAFLIIGPVLMNKRLEGKECQQLGGELDIDAWELQCALAEIKTFSFMGIKSVTELLADVAHNIVELSYEKYSLAKRHTVPSDLGAVIDRVYSSFYFDELLSTLLDVTISATKAQAGSIMLLDRESGELTIKVSRGLKDEVVKNTRVKVGEGIAGLVARDRKSLLLDDDIKDQDIKDRLKRPQIRSAIVAPYQIQDRLVGVVNINTYKEEDRFNSDTLNLVGNLTRLASIAASGLSAKSDLP